MSLEEEQIQAEQEAETNLNELILLLLIAYSLSLKRSRSILAQLYGQYGEKTSNELMKYNRLKNLIQTITKDMNEAHKKNQKELKNGLFDIYKQIYQKTASSLNISAIKMSKTEINEILQKQIDNLTLDQRLERMRKRSISEIQKQISKGIKSRNTFEQMSNRLKKTIDQDARKIRSIARIEAHRLLNQARMDVAMQADQQGLTITKIWDGILDSKIRPAHKKLHKTEIPLHANFISANGGVGLAPGMMNNPSDDINCRCSIRLGVVLPI